MTRTLAIELGRFNINVNAVAPGLVDTQMARQAAARSGTTWDDFKASAEKTIPLGRIAKPEDIAGVVSFLCSRDAAHISGQVISVRGGP